MLIQNELVGVLESVPNPQTSEKGQMWQEILIRQKAPTDNAGIPRGDDKIFPIMIFGKETIEKVWTACKEVPMGGAVVCKVYLNSNARTNESKTYYNIQLKLKDMRPL